MYDQFVSFRPWANLSGLSSTSRQKLSCNIVLTPKLDIMPFTLAHFLSFFILFPYKFEEPSLSTGFATSTDTILNQKNSATFAQNFLSERRCLPSLKTFLCLLLLIRCHLYASREQQPWDQVPQTRPEYYFLLKHRLVCTTC